VEDANGSLYEVSKRKVCGTPHCSKPCFHIGLCNPSPGDQDRTGRTRKRKKTENEQLELAIAASLKA
jgi:hypothetical protein